MPDREPIQLGYAVPRVRVRVFWSPLTPAQAICAMIVAGAMYAILAMAYYHFPTVFREFNVQLPPITRLYLEAARWCYHGAGWTVLWAGPFLAAIGLNLLARSLRADRSGRIPFGLGSLIMALAMGAIVLHAFLALVLPLLQVIEGVSGPGGGRR